jgi:hypothetical protein
VRSVPPTAAGYARFDLHGNVRHESLRKVWYSFRNTCELRFRARPGKGAPELELMLPTITLTVVFLTLICIVSLRRNPPPLGAAEIIAYDRPMREKPFQGPLQLATNLLPRRTVPTMQWSFKVALTDHATRFAKRVAKEYVFVASGGRKGVFSLAPPINRLRDYNRADRSPSQDPAPVFSLQLLDQDRF